MDDFVKFDGAKGLISELSLHNGVDISIYSSAQLDCMRVNLAFGDHTITEYYSHKRMFLDRDGVYDDVIRVIGILKAMSGKAS